MNAVGKRVASRDAGSQVSARGKSQTDVPYVLIKFDLFNRSGRVSEILWLPIGWHGSG